MTTHEPSRRRSAEGEKFATVDLPESCALWTLGRTEDKDADQPARHRLPRPLWFHAWRVASRTRAIRVRRWLTWAVSSPFGASPTTTTWVLSGVLPAGGSTTGCTRLAVVPRDHLRHQGRVLRVPGE